MITKRKFVKRTILLTILYVINFIWAKNLVQEMLIVLKNNSYKIISLDVTASFFAIAILALYFLFIETLPFYILLYLKHNDILYPEERKVMRYLILTIPLGILGSMFSFKVVTEFILPFFVSFSAYLGIEEIIGFSQLITLILVQGFAFFMLFQIPLIIKLLTTIGIVTKKTLKQKNVRVGFLWVVLLISSWLTPPDLVSLSTVAIPIYGTYELGILISK